MPERTLERFSGVGICLKDLRGGQKLAQREWNAGRERPR